MASLSVSERNARISDMMRRFFAQASSKGFEIDKKNAEILEPLFQTDAWGFREILLVIVIARLLDNKFLASKALYDCNPRSLYEGPIRSALLDSRIPHRKSGPLNIAKAAEAIDKHWAAQRRPSSIALQLVMIVERIERMTVPQLEKFSADLHARFLGEASRVADLSIEVVPEAEPSFLFSLCRQLIEEAPDAGNTPQRIVGLLLEEYHLGFDSGIKVVGHEDRASVTSTTSKKPGDIMEKLADDTIATCYEVTVKPFNQPRVVESSDAIRQYNREHGCEISEIIVICRSQDAHPESRHGSTGFYFLGEIHYEYLSYYFIEIFEWIMAQLLRMTPTSRINFFNKLHKYVDDPSTAEKVKQCFMRWHKGHLPSRT